MAFNALSRTLSPAGVLNAISPLIGSAFDPGIPFGRGLSLDVYRPLARAQSPTVVFFYGGGWDSGERAMYRFVGAALAARGVTVVIPDYRVYPAVRFPAFLEDAALAVGWTRQNICSVGERPVLLGHSAGAHIAAMLAFDPQWLGGVGLHASRDIAGLVGLSGPYDFLPLRSARLGEIFGPAAGRAGTQPINFVTAHAPPALLAAGVRDRVVDPQNSVRLARRIAETGGVVTLKLYPLAAHAGLIGAFAWPLRFLAPVFSDTLTFIDGVAGHGAAATHSRIEATC